VKEIPRPKLLTPCGAREEQVDVATAPTAASTIHMQYIDGVSPTLTSLWIPLAEDTTGITSH